MQCGDADSIRATNISSIYLWGGRVYIMISYSYELISMKTRNKTDEEKSKNMYVGDGCGTSSYPLLVAPFGVS